MGANEETITLEKLDEIERLDREYSDHSPLCIRARIKAGNDLGGLGLDFLPRLARAYRATLAAFGATERAAERAVDDAYARGRREAIEEAATFLRGAAVAQIRAMSEPGESPIQACASAIIRHEAYRGQ